MAKNKNLHKARRNKNDEFYTQIGDVEKEIKHYKEHFRNKTVYLNADDPQESAFFKFFSLKFKDYALKKLIVTGYKIKNYKNFSENDSDTSYVTFYEGERMKTIALKGDGDFRSEESIEFLKEADIVITNPPFSLFREYVAQLIEYDKNFLVLGNMNALTYKGIFPLIKDNKMWLGVNSNKTMEFRLHPDYKKWNRVDEHGNKYGSVPSITWFTNLQHAKRNDKLVPFRKYTPEAYPKYDNYDAINIDKVVDIPMDYDGEMGVPITFIDKYNPEQFEIIGRGQGDLLSEKGLSQKFVDDYYKSGQKGSIRKNNQVLCLYKEGVPRIPYMRIIIKRKIN